MRRTASAGSSTRMHSYTPIRHGHASRVPGELGHQLERTRLVRSHDQRRRARRLPRGVPLADPLLRTEQPTIVEELVGHRRRRFVAPTGEEQLLDLRRGFRDTRRAPSTGCGSSSPDDPCHPRTSTCAASSPSNVARTSSVTTHADRRRDLEAGRRDSAGAARECRRRARRGSATRASRAGSPSGSTRRRSRP